MSLRNTDIQGSVNVSRNANVGGNAKVNGDVTVGHNLKIEGWLDAHNIKGTCKGLYASEEKLKGAYPLPMPGWFALVGDTLPADVWRAEPSGHGLFVWTPTGEQGGDFTIWPDQLETDVRELQEGLLDEAEAREEGDFALNSKIDAETQARQGADQNLGELISLEAQARKSSDDSLQELIGQLRADFEALVGDNASDAIDNFNEILAFLEGMKDSDTLAAKLAELRLECSDNKTELLGKLAAEATAREQADTALGGRIDAEADTREEADTALGGRIDAEADTREEADTALGGRLDIVEAKTSDTVVCSGFLTAAADPSEPGTYIRRDAEGDPVMIVAHDDSGTITEYPKHGKIYICDGIGYIFDGIMLEPTGHRRIALDGGTPASRTGFHLQINGGTPATRATILKQIDGGTPRKR